VVWRADDGVRLEVAPSEQGSDRAAVTPQIVDPDRPLGPPSDPRHRRAWTDDQLDLLLLSCGLDVERRWRLPGSATSTGRHRVAARWLRLPIPGVRRSTVAVLARRRGGASAQQRVSATNRHRPLASRHRLRTSVWKKAEVQRCRALDTSGRADGQVRAES
jgi:hypothetical protein